MTLTVKCFEKLLIAAFLLTATNVASAQSDRCHSLAIAMENGSREAATFANLRHCKAQVQQIANVIRGIGLETDTVYLNYLRWPGSIRHPAIVTAAMRLAEDEAATVPARIFAEMVLIHQFGDNLSLLPSAGWSFIASARPGAACALSVSGYETVRVPGDLKITIAKHFRAMSTDETQPAGLQYLAGCVNMITQGVLMEKVTK